jgi:hypothetical protein
MQQKTFAQFMDRSKKDALEQAVRVLFWELTEKGYSVREVSETLQEAAWQTVRRHDEHVYDYHKKIVRLADKWIENITDDGHILENPSLLARERRH